MLSLLKCWLCTHGVRRQATIGNARQNWFLYRLQHHQESSEWLKLTGAKRAGGNGFYPPMKGFFYFTLLVSWESFFWPLYSLYINATALGALEPDWIVSSVCLLSSLSQFQRAYQKSETWILKRSLTTPAHHIITLPAKWCPGPQGATRILVFESSHPVKILKSPWE